MQRRLAWLCGFVAVFAMTATARAQGIDCSKARSPTEKAICASPALLSLDHQVAVAYADAIARQPTQREAMRTDLLRWLRQRDTTCNVQASAMERCLSGQLTARLAALAPPASAATVPPASMPMAPAPPVQAALAEPQIPPATDNPPPPGATLDATSLQAAAEADTLLHVTSPGRFAIAAHSPSGAGLQLVDMLTGPSEVAGAAGSQDGRLDRLLDIGTYKLRVFSAPGATGAVTLTVAPFHDGAAPAALPAPGHPLATTLRDGEQRAYWLLVPPGSGNNVRIEAAGRSLADLRLWRDGRELTALQPARLRVEPTPGHPLDDLRLTGHVEPGTYLAVAYGGPAATWTDGAADQPLNLRAGVSNALAEGWAGGNMGPFGSEVFSVPPATRLLLRLDLPQAAAAELRSNDQTATIAKNSREPTATVTWTAATGGDVEVHAAAGQAYTLRALNPATNTMITGHGTYWVSAVTTGMGGDEVPPALLLQRFEGPGLPMRIITSTAPRIGPGAAWHGRFDLRGPTDLMFEMPTGGDVAFSSSGVPVLHRHGQMANLPGDFYVLTVEPQTGALGAIDLVVGPPGVAPPPLATPLPPDPVIPIGLQTLAAGQSLRLATGSAPGTTTGLTARPAPVALAEGPLTATVQAGNTLSIPVQVAPGGSLAVTELGVGPIAFGQQDAGVPGRTTVVIPVADRSRTVVLAWHRTETALPPIPPPPPAGQVAAVQAGTPAFLDLARGEERGFALTVPQGGLFRVETLGRLHTAARLATPFIPDLARADGNGSGQNMLIQTALRAGRYRVDVRTVDSAGHLGLVASTAPLLTGDTLHPGGSVRATLPSGSGVAFPVDIAGGPDDRYHFDVLSLGAGWTGRLEDAEGWPVVTPGLLDGLEPALRPGHYNLVVTPDSVARQVVVRLTAITKPIEITGHGPHALPFEAPQHATWREPDSKDRPRDPDVWRFSLAGPAEVTLRLTDGMVADLHRTGATDRVARIVDKWNGTLPAGDYQLDATSLGRNDRLTYTVSLSSPVLQPGVPRSVSLPATVPFSLGEARVVSLTSWGSLPVTGVIRRDDGTVVTRARARPDDWNIAASRLLPAGRYTVTLQSAAPPGMTTPSDNSAGGGGNDDQSDAPADDEQDAQTAATQGANLPKPASPGTSTSSDANSDDTPDSDNAPKVELSLALPPALPPAPAPAEAAELPGNGVHVLTLPQPAAGGLVVAQASAAAATVLTLERQDSDGWRIVAIDTGRTARVASPADSDPAPWRVEAWTVDGGTAPIRLAARSVTITGQQPGQVTLTPLDGMPAALAAARVSVSGPGILSLAGTPGLFAGGWPGHALEQAGTSAIVAGTDLWLLDDKAVTVTINPLSFTPGSPTALLLPAGLSVALATAASQDGQIAVWRAESGSGQPNLGLGGGIADGSAIALAGSPVSLHSDGEAARVVLTRLVAKLAAERAVDSSAQLVVPSGGALPIKLPPGSKALQLDLAPGLAAFAGWHDATPVAVWGAQAAVSRSLAGAWTDLLLVNTGSAAAPARLAVQPAPEAPMLQPGQVVKRFFGAAGSFDLPFDAPSGARLMSAGDITVTAATAASVARGKAVPVAGSGHAIVQHGPGALALWLEAAGTSPWPQPAAQSITLPLRMTMSGPAMALSFTADGPVLLHVTTTAPVLAGLQQAGQTSAPALFAAGAELHRAVTAGPVTLLLFSADDGPLAGTVAMWSEKLAPLGEGLGEPVTIPPGGAAAFSFALAKPATIGVGLRAEPDRATARLLDATGKIVGEGVAQLRTLAAGAYVLEAQVPPDASPTVLRPALIGITPRGNGPPPDVVQSYLELVGMKPQGTP